MDYQIDDTDLPPKKPLGRPKGSHKKKMTQAEQKSFISEAIRVILDQHLSYLEFVSYCADKDISRSQANEYWLRCWGIMKKKFELEKDKLVLKHITKYWDIYQEALQNSDLTNTRQALNDLAKLQGLNEPDKVEVRGTTIKLNFGEQSE
jgi:hypothetical protein